MRPGANQPVPTGALRADFHRRPGAGPEIDVSALLLDGAGTVRDDADLVFYNQPRHASGAVRHTDDDAIEIDLTAVDADVDRIVLAASTDGGTFGEVHELVLRITVAGEQVAEFPIDASIERALIGGELYRRGEGWKFRAIGQGYAEGLAALATDFGVTVDENPAGEDPTAPQEPTVRTTDSDDGRTEILPSAADAPTVVVSAAQEQTAPWPEPEWPAHLPPLPVTLQAPLPDPRLAARTQQVAATLAQLGASGAAARVALVLDASGSMSTAYVDGVVGRIAERVAAVAAVLDIGVLPVWKFAETAMRLPDLQAADAASWAHGLDYQGVGLRNNEPAAIRAVLQHAAPASGPTLVLFFTDGDVRRNIQTSMLMRTAARKPLFWQFVGLGPADFTRYSKLDTMKLRRIDNCGFVTVRDPDRIPDRRFYDLVLGEFPRWLATARSTGIIS